MMWLRPLTARNLLFLVFQTASVIEWKQLGIISLNTIQLYPSTNTLYCFSRSGQSSKACFLLNLMSPEPSLQPLSEGLTEPRRWGRSKTSFLFCAALWLCSFETVTWASQGLRTLTSALFQHCNRGLGLPEHAASVTALLLCQDVKLRTVYR